VCARDDCERIFLEYGASMGTQDEPLHVFSALYRAGLLGLVDVDLVTGRTVQKFLLPGERPFEHGDGLPESSHYLVHPILAPLVAEANPLYARNLDRANEIGTGRAWRDGGRDEELCAVRADIVHFSAFMKEGTREAEIRGALRQALDKRRPQCVLVREDGDSFLLLHREPREAVSLVKGIQVELYETTGEARLRVAMDFGPVGLERDRAGDVIGIWRGHEVVRNVARIEPFVEPDQIWVTDRFKAMLERSPSFYRAEPIAADVRPGVRASDGAFNVKKTGSSEDDHWLQLFRIVEPGRA